MFLMFWSKILELDTSDVAIIEERTPDRHESAVIPSDTLGQNPLSVDTNTIQTSQYPKYRFKHFTGDKICTIIRRTCQILGIHGNLPLLVDYFLDLFHESKVHRKQAVYVINEIIVGFASREDDNTCSNGKWTGPAQPELWQGDAHEIKPDHSSVFSGLFFISN